LQLFYADDLLRGYYKDWITHIVTRTNTITGQRYVDDPTILAWCEGPPAAAAPPAQRCLSLRERPLCRPDLGL
jgi:hypothetical protein